MTVANDPPFAGVLRSVYFLAVAGVGLFVVITGIFSFYESPGPGFEPFTDVVPAFEAASSGSSGAAAQVFGNSRDTYDRNVSLILSAIAAGVFAAAILGLGSRFNPLRAGLLLGGLGLFLISMGFWANSADQWVGFLMSLIVFAVLAGGYYWLEEGLPLKPMRRLEPADIAPSSGGPPPPPPPPPPPFTPPPSPRTDPSQTMTPREDDGDERRDQPPGPLV